MSTDDADTGGDCDYVALGGEPPEPALGGTRKKGAQHTAVCVHPGGGPGRRDVLRAPHAPKRHASRSPKRAAAGAAADKKTELSEALLGCLKPGAPAIGHK